MGRRRIEIYFDRTVASRVKEQYAESAREEPDGGVVLTLFSETLEYPSRLVLSFATHARPLSPPELVQKVADDARKVLAMYAAD